MSNFLKKEARNHHIVLTALFVLFMFGFIFYRVAESVILDPRGMIHHTSIVYYDGKFSSEAGTEDTQTALFVLNQSDEVIYATVYEYDKYRKEIRNAIQIMPHQNQFIKTEGPGVVYLNNLDQSAKSVIKFSRWYSVKKYFIPQNYSF